MMLPPLMMLPHFNYAAPLNDAAPVDYAVPLNYAALSQCLYLSCGLGALYGLADTGRHQRSTQHFSELRDCPLGLLLQERAVISVIPLSDLLLPIAPTLLMLHAVYYCLTLVAAAASQLNSPKSICCPSSSWLALGREV